jgi:hypothetical protein
MMSGVRTSADIRPQAELYQTRCPIYNVVPLPTDEQYDCRDRLDIINLLNSYGHLFDGGFRDAWIERIFTNDIEWTLLPADANPEAAVVMRGHDQIRTRFAQSESRASLFLKEQGLDPAEATVFHQITDICVVDQTPSTAHVVARQFVGVGHEGLVPPFQRFASVVIEGELIKRDDGRWRVRRWRLTSGAGRAMSRGAR